MAAPLNDANLRRLFDLEPRAFTGCDACNEAGHICRPCRAKRYAARQWPPAWVFAILATVAACGAVALLSGRI